MRQFGLGLILFLTACHSAAVRRVETPPWERPQVVRRIEEPESDPARLAPADARWYVRVDKLPDWFDESSGDPLARHLWTVIKSFQPPTLWKTGADKLGITNNQAVHLYFGRTVALVDQELHDKHGVVVMSRAEEDDLRKLPDAMGLKPYGKPDHLGPFKLYSGAEETKKYVFAIGKRWLMMTEEPYADHLRLLASAVAAGAKPIADHEKFNTLLAKLPGPRDAVILVRDPHRDKPDDCHALTLHREGEALTADYIARTAELNEYLRDSQEVPGVDFGPMPASVITAVTVNVLQYMPPWGSALNIFLFPHNFRRDIRPSIAPPVVAFLASLPPDLVEPNPGVSVPVLGIAVRLTDPRAAAELDRLVKGAHFLLTATRLDLAKGFFGVDRIERNGLTYHVADFGPAIQSRIDDVGVRRLTELPSSAGLTKVTFGRIGNYYLICTQEAFFHEWRRASLDASRRLTNAPTFREMGFEDKPHTLASFLTRAPELGALLRDVAEYWKKAQESGGPPPRARSKPEPKGDKARAKPEGRQEGIEQPLRWVAEGLQHRRSFAIQLWRDEEKRLRGHLRISPNERAGPRETEAPAPAAPAS